jgi:hypothetical protein
MLGKQNNSVNMLGSFLFSSQFLISIIKSTIMKLSTCILFFLLLATLHTSAQIKALTDDGREVILYKNGTWKFLKGDQAKQDSIRISGKTYSKTPAQTFFGEE